MDQVAGVVLQLIFWSVALKQELRLQMKLFVYCSINKEEEMKFLHRLTGLRASLNQEETVKVVWTMMFLVGSW